MEKFLLGIFLALNELNIIHNEHIDLAVLLPKALHTILANGGDQIIGKLLCRYIGNPRLGFNF